MIGLAFAMGMFISCAYAGLTKPVSPKVTGYDHTQPSWRKLCNLRDCPGENPKRNQAARLEVITGRVYSFQKIWVKAAEVV